MSATNLPPDLVASSPTAPELSVAAPVYDEEEAIESVVRYWVTCIERLDVDAEIVLCNDGSRDRTGEILEALTHEIPNLRVVGGTEDHGYGHALSTAIASWRGRLVATIDSDGQFDLLDAGPMIARIAEKGLEGVSGYRVKKQDSFIRVLADRTLNLIVRLLFGTRLRDTNCALKVVRRDLIQALRTEAAGFPFPTEVCLRLEAAGARLEETPVTHRERQAGESKLKVWKTGWSMLWFLAYLRLRLSLIRKRVIRES